MRKDSTLPSFRREDHLRLTLQGCKKQGDVFRTVLKVGVHEHDDLASRVFERGRYGGMLPEVTTELHDLGAGVSGRDVF